MKSYLSFPLIIIMVMMIFLSVVSVCHCQETVETSKATIVHFEGQVTMKKPKSNEWVPAKANQVFESDYQLKTGKESYCMILLGDGSIIKIGENTHIQVKILKSGKEANQSRFKLFIGKVWSSVNKTVEKKTNFEVEAPYTLAAVKGTVFEVSSDGTNDVIMVFDGTVNAVSGEKQINVNQDHHIQSGKTGFKSKLARFDRKKLSQWHQWNLQVDREVAFILKKLVSDVKENKQISAREILEIRNILKKYKNPLKLRQKADEIKNTIRELRRNEIRDDLRRDMRNHLQGTEYPDESNTQSP